MTSPSPGDLKVFPAPETPVPETPAPETVSRVTASRDEDYSKEYEPVVRLAEVKTETGEEDEIVLYKVRAKLFRFSKELNEWKERGTGDVRILKHKESNKIRLVMRREKTLKICLNHYVNPVVDLAENVGSDRSWVWHGVDYADGERDEALLAIRFKDSTNACAFKDAYDDARNHMRILRNGDILDKEVKDNETEKDTTKEETAPVDSTEEDAAKNNDIWSVEICQWGILFRNVLCGPSFNWRSCPWHLSTWIVITANLSNEKRATFRFVSTVVYSGFWRIAISSLEIRRMHILK